MKFVTKLHRSSAIQAYRELLVWDFHPLVIRAVRAHVVSQNKMASKGRSGRKENVKPARQAMGDQLSRNFVNSPSPCTSVRRWSPP